MSNRPYVPWNVWQIAAVVYVVTVPILWLTGVI